MLRSRNEWVPIDKTDANRLALKVKPLTRADHRDLGVALDRSVWVEVPLEGRWMAAFRLANKQGQPVISEMRVFPDESEGLPAKPWRKYQRRPISLTATFSPMPGARPAGRWSGDYPGAIAPIPPGGLSARVWHSITMRSFKRLLRSIMERHVEFFRNEDIGVPLSTPLSSAHSGRPGRSDASLARMARTYEIACLANRSPILAVAKVRGLSVPRARDAIRRARVRGLLSPASKQGKGGGFLTEKAKMLLNGKKKPKGGAQNGTKR